MIAIAAVDPLELGRLALMALMATAPQAELAGGKAFSKLEPELIGASDVVLLTGHRGHAESLVHSIDAGTRGGLPVVVLTDGDPFLARRSAEAGATVLTWTLPASKLLACIFEAARQCAEDATRSGAIRARHSLSGQEQRVLRHYAQGASLREVAAALDLNIHLVEEYVSRARAKYAASGRPARTKVELYMRAVEDGLLPLPC